MEFSLVNGCVVMRITLKFTGNPQVCGQPTRVLSTDLSTGLHHRHWTGFFAGRSVALAALLEVEDADVGTDLEAVSTGPLEYRGEPVQVGGSSSAGRDCCSVRRPPFWFV